ncbi:unnamed protein product, partial [Brachionus calyciflorus]
VFTKIDLKSAYHQIAVHEESVEVTAYICEFEIFEYLFMSMGIKTAPAKFQKFMEKIFGKFIRMKMLGVFLDDSFIFTNTVKYGLKTHIDTVMDVIQTLNQNSLEKSMDKSVPLADLILTLPNFEHMMVLTTDACEYGYGAVLEQIIDGESRPIAYFSKNYTAAQKKYSTSEKELLAVVMLERWLLRLALYQFNILCKPGKDNVVADMLSRLPDVNCEETEEKDYLDNLVAPIMECENSEKTNVEENKTVRNNTSELMVLNANEQEQNKDEDIKWIKDLIKIHGDKKPIILIFENVNRRILFKQYDNLCLNNDILYRNSEDRNGHKLNQIVLPKNLVKKVVNQIHSTVFNGHLGKTKTSNKITDRFYRPLLKDEKKECIKHCEICQKTKNTQPKRLAEMLYFTPCRPNQIITTDLTGPFTKTERGNSDI